MQPYFLERGRPHTKNNVDKTSRAYLEGRVTNARHTLLIVLVFTLINLLMLLTESSTYFLFSASVPYYLTAFGMGMDMGMGTSGIGVFTATALVISAIILAVYLVCWLLTKKHPGWYIVALVLFAVDTAVLVLAALGFDLLTDSIIDIAFHAWVLVELVQAINANGKLKNMPPEPVIPEGQPIVAEELPQEQVVAIEETPIAEETPAAASEE